MYDFWCELAAWQSQAFGPDSLRGPHGSLAHLEKELQECKAAPHDIMEYADLLFFVFQAARRAGFSYAELETACFEKLEENKKRKWPDWKTLHPDDIIEHIRHADNHAAPSGEAAAV